MTSIVRVITRLNIGGPARHVLLLNDELEKHGFRSHLVSGAETEREGRLTPRGDQAWTQVASLKRSVDPVADVKSYFALRRLLRTVRPDIVHTHLAKAGALGRLAARSARVPITVHTYHGHVLDGYFPAPVARAFIEAERLLARRTTALIAVSSRVRDDLLDLRIGKPSQWHVVPVGLDLDDLLGSELPREKARERLGLPSRAPLVGIVGRLVPIKDHATFLRAAAELARQLPDAYFVLAGDGELRGELEREAQRLLGDRALFVGWVKDLEALYRSLDVVVLTSLNEGTPTALIEAAAAATPVVATRVGGVPDVVQDERIGTLVDPGDVGAITRAISGVLTGRGPHGDGRALVSANFSSKRLVNDLVDLYASLTRSRAD